MKKVVIYFVVSLFLLATACEEKTEQSHSTNEQTEKKEHIDNKSEEKIAHLETKVEKLKEEIARLQNIEDRHSAIISSLPYVSMYSSQFLFALQSKNIDAMQKLLDDELRIESRDGDFYLFTPEEERMITYDDDSILKRWFLEGVSIIDNKNVSATVRLYYVDNNNESIKESRNYLFNFVKTNDDWKIINIQN